MFLDSHSKDYFLVIPSGKGHDGSITTLLLSRTQMSCN